MDGWNEVVARCGVVVDRIRCSKFRPGLTFGLAWLGFVFAVASGYCYIRGGQTGLMHFFLGLSWDGALDGWWN